jgi:hypothetical protein
MRACARPINIVFGEADPPLSASLVSIETRSRPRSLAACPRGFAFYVARPARSIRG